MIQLTFLIPVILCIAFWSWMFWDMTNNEYLPPNTRNYWLFAFLFLNVAAAAYYYVNEYRRK